MALPGAQAGKEATGRGNSRHTSQKQAGTELPRSQWGRKNVACCNKCRELLAFSRLPLLQDTGVLCTRKNCLLQDGNKQQKRALSMAKQEGEEMSLKE